MSFMTAHKNYRRLMKRLRRLRQKAIPKALSKLISKNDLNKIFDFLDISKAQIKIINSLREKAEKRFEFLYNLIHLPYGESIRLAKEKTGLSRTLNVLREKHGRYKLYLETKSKLEDNSKQVLPNVCGKEKTGKPSWRLGTNYTEEFNLTLTFCKDLTKYKNHLKKFNRFKDVHVTTEMALNALKQQDAYNNFQDEIACNNKIKDKEYVIKYKQGQPFVHGNKFKASIYCQKAIGTLQDVIEGKIQTMIGERLLLSEMLLKGLCDIHRSGIVHQDLKPENILIFENRKGQLSLKIADFGLSSTHMHHTELALCTPWYHSPEIALWTYHEKNSESDHYAYFHKGTHSHNAYSNQWVYSTNVHWSGSYISPHYLNDCWSAGIVLFQLYHMGEYPKKTKTHDSNVSENPLLSGLLEVERKKRATAKQALDLFNQNKELIFSTMKPDKCRGQNSELLKLNLNKDKDIIQGMQNMRISSFSSSKSSSLNSWKIS